MKTIPADEVDALVKFFDEGYTVHVDEAYRRFRGHELAPPADLPADPFSAEYTARYLALYRQISQRSVYTPDNEKTHFRADERVDRPFPFSHQSTKLAATHFRLMGQLLDMLDLRPGADILECGFGWGNTTLALAMLGFNVTGLDIEESYASLVRQRAQLHKVDNIDLITSDYLWTETTDRKFDAVIFFESFHHCWEFRRLLAALHRVLKPGGKVYFAAEPINRAFKVPWGIRLDGESVYVARKWGWMELGFHSDFFAELLLRTGWFGCSTAPHFWVAAPKSQPMVFAGSDPRLHTHWGVRQEGVMILAAPDHGQRSFAVFGPYIDLAPGPYSVKFRFTNLSSPNGVCVDVCHSGGKKVVATHECDSSTIQDGSIALNFNLAEPAHGAEVRLTVPSGFRGVLQDLSLQAF